MGTDRGMIPSKLDISILTILILILNPNRILDDLSISISSNCHTTTRSPQG